ncbi:MAG: hypothetical protein HZA24_12685 [Nitrospirae bacterium]|nr:hypothetical protein [Nitrospirota bacterium]
MTADEALAPQPDPEERDALEDAKGFLLALLADGPLSSRQVKADAEGAGHSWATVRRAQKELRVEVTKTGLKGGWEWHLPARRTEGAHWRHTEDAQVPRPQNMSILSTFDKINDLGAPQGAHSPEGAQGAQRGERGHLGGDVGGVGHLDEGEEEVLTL